MAAAKKSVYPEYEVMKEEIVSKLGYELDESEVLNNQVLLAIFVRPEKTKGGIILTENVRKEDEYQGKVGLIVKMGSAAYQDDGGKWFQGRKPVLGDWVVIRASDGWALGLNKVPCRMIDDTVTRMIIPHPEYVW